MLGDNKEKMWYWTGYGLKIPASKADSCIHAEHGRADDDCYTQMMVKVVFALIEGDVCANCSFYKPKMRLKDHLLCGKKKEAVIDV